MEKEDPQKAGARTLEDAKGVLHHGIASSSVSGN